MAKKKIRKYDWGLIQKIKKNEICAPRKRRKRAIFRVRNSGPFFSPNVENFVSLRAFQFSVLKFDEKISIIFFEVRDL